MATTRNHSPTRLAHSSTAACRSHGVDTSTDTHVGAKGRRFLSFSPEELPDLILVAILDLLDEDSLLSLTQLDRGWRFFLHNAECATAFWHQRIIRDMPLLGPRLLAVIHSSPSSSQSWATLYFLALRHARIYTLIGTDSPSTAPRSIPSPPNLHLLATTSSILRAVTKPDQIDMYDVKTLEHLDVSSDSLLLQFPAGVKDVNVYQGSSWIICQPPQDDFPAILMLDDGSEHVLAHPDLAPASKLTYASGVGPTAWVYKQDGHRLLSVGLLERDDSVVLGVDEICVAADMRLGRRETAAVLAGNGGVLMVSARQVWYAHRSDSGGFGLVFEIGDSDDERVLDCRACASPAGDAVLLFAHHPHDARGVFDLMHWTPPAMLPKPVLSGVRDAGFSSDGKSVFAVLESGIVQRVRFGTWQVEQASVFGVDERVVYSSYVGGLGVYVTVPLTPEAVMRRLRESCQGGGIECDQGPVRAMYSVM